MAQHPAGSVTQAALLSFVAAFVDTCGFVGLFGTFTAHVTGNFVLLGSQLVHAQGEILAKLLSLPVFIAAIWSMWLLRRALVRKGIHALGPLLLTEALLIMLAPLAAWWTGAPRSADDPASLLTGMLMIAAMGFQNGLMRIELTSLPPTTVMTGNVTGAAIDLITIWTVTPSEQDKGAAARERLGKSWPSMLAFLVGAACGAGGYAFGRFWCLLLPAAICALLGARMRRAIEASP